MLAYDPNSCKSLQGSHCDFTLIHPHHDLPWTVEHESNDAIYVIVVPSDAILGSMRLRLCLVVEAWYPISMMCITSNPIEYVVHDRLLYEYDVRHKSPYLLLQAHRHASEWGTRQ